jgi:toxin ParE1/3/4
MTLKPVVPRERARQDIEAAIDHYRREAGEQVALAFVDRLQQVFGSICRHPASGSSRYAYELDLPGPRSRSLNRYPYLIFYVERDNHIDVWRVLHAHRDIPAWLQAP